MLPADPDPMSCDSREQEEQPFLPQAESGHQRKRPRTCSSPELPNAQNADNYCDSAGHRGLASEEGKIEDVCQAFGQFRMASAHAREYQSIQSPQASQERTVAAEREIQELRRQMGIMKADWRLTHQELETARHHLAHHASGNDNIGIEVRQLHEELASARTRAAAAEGNYEDLRQQHQTLSYENVSQAQKLLMLQQDLAATKSQFEDARDLVMVLQGSRRDSLLPKRICDVSVPLSRLHASTLSVN